MQVSVQEQETDIPRNWLAVDGKKDNNFREVEADANSDGQINILDIVEVIHSLTAKE
ncbi:MAG: hypothetical protein K6D61_06670 [Prevotella sp.]|nr:hypothetical protein [Prevotella sp.]